MYWPFSLLSMSMIHATCLFINLDSAASQRCRSHAILSTGNGSRSRSCPSTTSTAQPRILEDDEVKVSALFCIPKREFWIDSPNGHHLCLVLPLVGPSCCSLSKGIYSKVKPALAVDIGRQSVKATALLHSKGFCYGGKTFLFFSTAPSRNWTDTDTRSNCRQFDQCF